MALQGTIDTFPLTDVLTLLASSSRSGSLTLTGDRGSGTVWIADQSVLGGHLADGRVASADRAVFELLRFEDGSFEFLSLERGDFPDFGAGASTVEDCLATAATMLEEWTAIEAVVPSIRHRVDLAAELPAEKFTIDRALWRVLVVTAGATSVAELADTLGVDDYEGSALVASMVNEGLVEVHEPLDIDELLAAGRADEGTHSALARVEDTPTQPAIDLSGSADGSENGSFPDHFPIDDLLSSEETEEESPWVPIDSDDSWNGDAEDSAESDAGERSFDGWDELVDTHGSELATSAETDAAEEVLRQMSKLSPKAAEAIAAALGTAEQSAAGNDDMFASMPEIGDELTSAESDADPGPISFLDSF
ncbi:MAG: DUF4388 domain-containing protein [Microthrixaceae bacterium]